MVAGVLKVQPHESGGGAAYGLPRLRRTVASAVRRQYAKSRSEIGVRSEAVVDVAVPRVATASGR